MWSGVEKEFSMRTALLLWTVILSFFVALQGCSSGGDSDSGTTTATLQSITITPSNPTIAVGATQQFTATGSYSDGASSDITATVSWISNAQAVASVNASGGLATGIVAGTATITATSGAISGSTTLAVIAPAGSDWTISNPGYPPLYGIAWSGTDYVAVGNSGEIITSPNGTAWTSHASGTTNDLSGIAWSGTQFVAVGELGTILTSPDGITWTLRASGSTKCHSG